MRHLEVLEKIKADLAKDDNVLALLVFGSVARGTFHDTSDIDLAVVYQDFEPGFEFAKDVVDGIDIGYSHWSLSERQSHAKKKPYRGYIFAHAKLLFDRGKIQDIQDDLLKYFAAHPDIEKVWTELEASYQEEKQKYGRGQTDIFEVYKELDERYAATN